jgi:hypothetical protein
MKVYAVASYWDILGSHLRLKEMLKVNSNTRAQIEQNTNIIVGWLVMK